MMRLYPSKIHPNISFQTSHSPLPPSIVFSVMLSSSGKILTAGDQARAPLCGAGGAGRCAGGAGRCAGGVGRCAGGAGRCAGGAGRCAGGAASDFFLRFALISKPFRARSIICAHAYWAGEFITDKHK